MQPKYEFKTKVSAGYLVYGIIIVIIVFVYTINQGKWNIENNSIQIWIFGLICVFLIYTLIFTPVAQLKVFSDHTVISGTGIQFHYNIPNESIIDLQSVTNAPFKDYWFLPLMVFNSKAGWKPGSKWHDWIPSNFIFFTDNALAIETSDMKLLISCRDPEKAVKKLEIIIESAKNKDINIDKNMS